jgi:hypothetical protein
MRSSIITRSCLLLIFSFSCLVSIGQDTIFQKTYSGNESNSNVMALAPDGYCMLVHDGFNQSLHLLKVDKTGSQQWLSPLISSALFPMGNSIEPTSDNGYIIAGSISDSSGGTRSFLIKANSTGGIQWTKTFSHGASGISDQGMAVKQTSDGGFVLAGLRGIINATTHYNHYSVVKTDNMGNVQWAGYYEKGEKSEVRDIIECPQGGYLITGGIEDSTDSRHKMSLVRISASGGLMWSKYYSGLTGYERGNSLGNTATGFIVAGQSNSFLPQGGVLVMETDNTGAPQWTKLYYDIGMPDARSMDHTPDGGYIIAGDYVSASSDVNMLLLKISSNGSFQWSKSFGTSSDFRSGYSVRTTSDGGYACLGNSFTASSEICLVKTDSSGKTGCLEQGGLDSFMDVTPTVFIAGGTYPLPTITGELPSPPPGIVLTEATDCSNVGIHEASETFFGIYPNPSAGKFTIDAGRTGGPLALEVIDVTGTVVKKLAVLSGDVIDLTGLAKGMYMIRAAGESPGLAGKIVIAY